MHEKETHQDSGDGGGVDGCPEPRREELAGAPRSLSWAVSNLCGREGANVARLSHFSLTGLFSALLPFWTPFCPGTISLQAPCVSSSGPVWTALLPGDYPGKSFLSLGLSFFTYYLCSGLNQWLPNVVLPRTSICYTSPPLPPEDSYID